LNISYPIKS